MLSIPRTSASLMCSVIISLSVLDPEFYRCGSLRRRLRWFRCGALPRSFTRVAHTPHYRLIQPINTFFLIPIHHFEAKFRFTLRPFADSNRYLSAQIVLDERCFVPAFLFVPGINAQRR